MDCEVTVRVLIFSNPWATNFHPHPIESLVLILQTLIPMPGGFHKSQTAFYGVENGPTIHIDRSLLTPAHGRTWPDLLTMENRRTAMAWMPFSFFR